MEATLSELEENLVILAEKQGCKLYCKQTNAEHEIINAIHDAKLKDCLLYTSDAADE